MEGHPGPDTEISALEGLGHREGKFWITPYGKVVPPNYGRHASEQDALDELVDRLVTTLDPAMIWLFGSRARGDARQDSDFDLLVVAKRDQGFGEDDYETVSRPLYGTGIAADVVPADLDVFQASLELQTSFICQIVREGRLVYGGMPK